MKKYKKIAFILIISLIIVEVISFLYKPKYAQNYLKFFKQVKSTNFNSNDSNDDIKVEYLAIKYAYKDDLNSEEVAKISEDGYYIYVLINNDSNVDINSTFEIGVDVKFKNDYIIKDGKYIDLISEKWPIKKKSKRIILIKTNKEVYEKYKDVSPYSEDLLIKINYFKYKLNLQWRKEWSRG